MKYELVDRAHNYIRFASNPTIERVYVGALDHFETVRLHQRGDWWIDNNGQNWRRLDPGDVVSEGDLILSYDGSLMPSSSIGGLQAHLNLQRLRRVEQERPPGEMAEIKTIKMRKGQEPRFTTDDGMVWYVVTPEKLPSGTTVPVLKANGDVKLVELGALIKDTGKSCKYQIKNVEPGVFKSKDYYEKEVKNPEEHSLTGDSIPQLETPFEKAKAKDLDRLRKQLAEEMTAARDLKDATLYHQKHLNAHNEHLDRVEDISLRAGVETADAGHARAIVEKLHNWRTQSKEQNALVKRLQFHIIYGGNLAEFVAILTPEEQTVLRQLEKEIDMTKTDNETSNKNSFGDSLASMVTGGISIMGVDWVIDLAARGLAEWRLSVGDVDGAKMILKSSTLQAGKTVAPLALLGAAHMACKAEEGWVKDMGEALLAPLEMAATAGFATVLIEARKFVFSGKLSDMSGLTARIAEAEAKALEAKKEEKVKTKVQRRAPIAKAVKTL